MFSQAVQNQPAPAQPGVYNNMSITVSMAGGNANVQNMNPMMGQMQMSSLQMPGMTTVCSEQVSSMVGTLATHTTHGGYHPRRVRCAGDYQQNCASSHQYFSFTGRKDAQCLDMAGLPED